MKKFLILFALAMCVTSLVAQTPISSVFGVKLGDSESTVISALNAQGKKGEWDSANNKRFYKISSPILGNIMFQVGTFTFDSTNKLEQVCFYRTRTGYEGDMFYDQFIAEANNCQRIFKKMRMELMGKYGSPQMEEEERIVWKSSNGNQIVLEYDNTDEFNSFGHSQFTRVAVTYKTQSSGGNSSNF